MFILNNICKSYDTEVLFENLTFQMQKGQKCALIGRNGSGKTTLFRMLIGQEIPDSGSIVIPKGYQLGYLEQHIKFTQPTVLEEALFESGIDANESYLAEKILSGLGFTEEDFDKNPAQFSGGYHLRLNLTKVLLKNPDCLLLDEPTNYLDIISIRWLERFLQKWPKEFVIISHDQEFLDRIINHSLGIYRKKIYSIKGKTADLFNKILEEEKVYEKTRQNIEKKKQHYTAFIERFGAKATKAKQAQSRQKAIDKMDSLEKLNEMENLNFDFIEAKFPGLKMLEAKNLVFNFDPAKPLITDFSLTIENGEKIAIIGKNARGKSTLLRLLIKDLQPIEGTVDHKVNLEIGYFGQTHIERLHPSLTIEEEIADTNPDLTITEVKGICGHMLFSQDLSKKKISQLSGGERSRVLLGKILAKPCNLIFLDEPTHHLDLESIEALISAINNFSYSCVIVTHNERMLNLINFTKLVVCKNEEQMIFLGNYEEFLEKVGWEEEKKLMEKGGDKKGNLEREKSKKQAQIKKKIENIEKQIVEKEKAHEKTKQELVDVSLKGDRGLIEQKTKLFNEQKNQIEALYESLEQLFIES